MVDVANGVSQVQHNGMSLHNSAKAKVIAVLVDEGLGKGLETSEISVLVYYTGQLDLVIHKIEAKTQATWKDMAIRRRPCFIRRCVPRRGERVRHH